jgi:hypothetical protein
MHPPTKGEEQDEEEEQEEPEEEAKEQQEEENSRINSIAFDQLMCLATISIRTFFLSSTERAHARKNKRCRWV